MTESRVAAIVLCWNDAERVRELLLQLAALSPAPGRVVVVDNGSAAGPPEFDGEFPFVLEVLSLPENLGFAAGVNRGAQRALALGMEWLWLVNSDVEIPAHALGSLLDVALAQPRCGMVGAVLTHPDGRLQARGGGQVNLWTGMVRHVRRSDQRCDYLSGACLLLRTSMLREIGLFDERFFFYWEDIELAARARAAGWCLAVADRCLVVHHEASTLGPWSAERWFFLFRGLKLYLAEHARAPRVAALLRLIHHTAVMSSHGRWDALRGARRGYLAKNAAPRERSQSARARDTARPSSAKIAKGLPSGRAQDHGGSA